MTVVVAVPPTYEPERRYVVGVLLGEFLGLEWRLEREDRGGVRISLDGHAGELVVQDGLFAHPESHWLTEQTLPRPPFDLPFLWPGDVFGTAFFALTRYEEAVKGERDSHGRFPASAAAVPDRPIVNELVELLWDALRREFPRLERREHRFEIVPSHDVDIPRCPARSVRGVAVDVVRLRDPVLAARRLAGRDPCDTFDFLMGASERRGLRSAFYFIADDASYSLDDPFVCSLLRRIDTRGHEIGVHPGYDTHRDGERLGREVVRLREVCARENVQQSPHGGRQHFLRWEAAETWQLWDDVGLAYDSTLGWAERGGFRAGVCYEYPVFNLRTRRPLGLRERPLVVMEATFLQYMGLGGRDALDAILGLKLTCRRYGGKFTVLWHNNRLQSARDRRLSESILDG